jgi:hypothetical protein
MAQFFVHDPLFVGARTLGKVFRWVFRRRYRARNFKRNVTLRQLAGAAEVRVGARIRDPPRVPY